jgi:prolyl oligopeptidase
MSLSGFQSSMIAPPSTPKRPVIDEYHGIKVTDDCRWLENWDDPTVKQWAAGQDARTRNYLEHLPKYDLIHARIAELIGTPSAWYDSLRFSGGMLFALQHLPQHQQPLLVALPSPDEPSQARVILDPNRLSERGAVAISFFSPSPDRKYVAAVLS